MLETESTLQAADLQAVDNHWAVLAVGKKKRDRVLDVAKAKLVRSAVGRQMTLDFKDRPGDSELLDRLALAYEMAAIEGLDSVLHPAADRASKALRKQCYAGACLQSNLSHPNKFRPMGVSRTQQDANFGTGL